MCDHDRASVLSTILLKCFLDDIRDSVFYNDHADVGIIAAVALEESDGPAAKCVTGDEENVARPPSLNMRVTRLVQRSAAGADPNDGQSRQRNDCASSHRFTGVCS